MEAVLLVVLRRPNPIKHTANVFLNNFNILPPIYAFSNNSYYYYNILNFIKKGDTFGK